MTECTNTVDLINNSTTNISCFTTDTNYSSESFYCDKLLFDFIYYETIVKWALFITITITMILVRVMLKPKYCFCCCILYLLGLHEFTFC